LIAYDNINPVTYSWQNDEMKKPNVIPLTSWVNVNNKINK